MLVVPKASPRSPAPATRSSDRAGGANTTAEHAGGLVADGAVRPARRRATGVLTAIVVPAGRCGG